MLHKYIHILSLQMLWYLFHHSQLVRVSNTDNLKTQNIVMIIPTCIYFETMSVHIIKNLDGNRWLSQ